MNTHKITCMLFTALILSACAPRVLLPGPAINTAHLDQHQYKTADGVSLPTRIWLPDNQPVKRIVIALHGFNDYSNFINDSASQLMQSGVATYAYDQRGFGGAPNAGLWSGTHALAQDLFVFIKIIKQRHPNIPVYVLGESMGGAVVIVTMTQNNAPKVNGLILAAPAVWAKSTMPWYQRWALTLGSYTLPWLKLSPNGLKITASDNLVMLRKLGRDPLIIKETRIDAMHGLTQLMGLALNASHQLPSNTLILYGEHDEVIPKRPTANMLARLSKAHGIAPKVAVYKQGYHMLLRDLNAQQPRNDIVSWMNNPKASLPSGADVRSIEWLLKE